MTLRGRSLQSLQALSGVLMLVSLVMGYGQRLGWVRPEVHIPWGFFIALGVSFTHAMTMFYFVGLGVSMRGEAGGRGWCDPYLAKASRFRARLAPLLGVAIVTLMAATILGGGSHTRWLPLWAHHAFGVTAVAVNLVAFGRSISLIGRQEALVASMERRLDRSRLSGHRVSRSTRPPAP